jgi:hypothetical protein
MRISFYILLGHKPIRNPFRVGKLAQALDTSSENDKIQFAILNLLLMILMTLSRNFSVMLMRKEERKILFEEYYAHIEEYEGQFAKSKSLEMSTGEDDDEILVWGQNEEE